MGKVTKGWNFSREHGFSGSCGGTPVKGYLRGGPVKAKAASKSGPHEVEHRDYKEYNAPHDEAEYPEVGTRDKPAGYARGGLHLNLKKGALHRELGVKAGHKIPAKKLDHALHSKNPLERKRAQFAENAKHWHHKAKGGKVADLHDPHLSEPYESRRGGPVKKAHGGHMKSSEPHGKAAKKGSRPYAMGGLARPPAHHGVRMGSKPPMVSALASPLASALGSAPMGGVPRMGPAPMTRPPMTGTPAPMGPAALKHGGRTKR